MVDFAQLVLSADSRGLKTGEQALNDIAATAERTEQRTNKATAGLSKGYEQVGKQSIFAGQQSRLVAMQLSQVAQQASATGNWIQAIAIQLPDLALGLGPIGIAAGAAAGAFLPLIANMVTSQEEGSELVDVMDSLEGALEGYREATENALLPASDLIDKFGAQAEGAQRVYEAMRRIKELEFAEAMQSAVGAISETLAGVQESLERFDMASTAFGRPEAISAIRTEVQYLENVFGLTLVQATRVNDALDALAAAQGPQQIADASMQLGDTLSQAADEGARLSPELRAVQKDAYQASLDAAEFARLTGAAIEPANSLAVAVSGVADQYARAAAFAAALTGRFPSRGTYGGVDRSAEGAIQGEGFQLPEVGPAPVSRGTAELSGFPWESIGRRSRGGGGSSRTKQISDEAREAQRIFEDTRTEAEKYQKELEDLNELHEMGYLDADTYARAIAKVGEEYQNASEQGEFFNDISEDLKNGILDAIVEGKNLSDTFEDIAKSIAKAALEAALFGTGPFAAGAGVGGGGGGLFGGLFSGLFGGLFSFDGGGFTGSGSRSGGMDGKGGYLAMVHPNETIIDHTKGGGGAGAVTVDVRTYVDENGNWRSEVERISKKEVSKATPGIVNASKQQSVPAMAEYQSNKANADWRS